MIGWRVRRVANLSRGNGVFDSINPDRIYVDTGGFTYVTGGIVKIKIPAHGAGYYMVGGMVAYDDVCRVIRTTLQHVTPKSVVTYLSQFYYDAGANNIWTGNTEPVIAYANVGDAFELWAQQNSGLTRNIYSGGSDITEFWGTYLGD